MTSHPAQEQEKRSRDERYREKHDADWRMAGPAGG
jgi:hypothetical protein